MNPQFQDSEAAVHSTLRWTLGVISWMFSLWTLLFGIASASAPDSNLPPLLFFGHAGLLAAAGFTLPKSRPGAWLLTGAAALGSLGFVAFALHRRNPEAALIDAAYPVLALLIGLRCRLRP